MSTKQTEALKLALEALEWINRVNAMEYEYQQKARESLNAVYEALAEQPAQQQEPVAWLDEEYDSAYTAAELDGGNVDGLQPLYTSPPASKPWVGLTMEDRYMAIRPLYNSDETAWLAVEHSNDEYEAMEAKLRKKNT